MWRGASARTWILGACVVLATLAGLRLLQRLAADPGIPFLWPYAPAAWIVEPTRTQLRAKHVEPVAVTFSRTFEIDALPGTARLRVRGFRVADVTLNDEPVVKTTPGSSWKDAIEADVARQLRTGTNTIAVRV